MTNYFGPTISNYFNILSKQYLNMISICDIGLKVLDLLEIVHGAGYTHNDISLDKITLGTN